MKRHRRTRRTGRQGIQHVSDLLSILVTEIEKDEATETRDSGKRASSMATAVAVTDTDYGQSTFSFYQPVGS